MVDVEAAEAVAVELVLVDRVRFVGFGADLVSVSPEL
jgi:hypothetical protein